MSDPIDPARWSDGGGPPGSLELVRAIARPPVLPPDLSALSRARMHRTLSPPRTRWIGPSLATAVVLGGITLWVTRPHEPEQALRPEPRPPQPGQIAVAPSGEDAGADALAQVVARPDGGSATRVDSPAEESVAIRRRAPTSSEVEATAPRRPRPPPDDEDETAVSMAPAAPPADGELIVQSMPFARVLIDLEDTGETTPFRRRLPAGAHRLGLRAADGSTYDGWVQIDPGETTRHAIRLAAPVTEPAPMVAAQACLARGDTQCVLRTLEHRRPTLTPAELRLLIETYRAVGNTPRMLEAMRGFVQRFPSDPRARQYRQVLAGAGAAAPEPAPVEP